MSDAITHYRQLREVTVDDLVAIAYVLDTTPAVLLSHIPVDMPEPEGPFATGLPSDVDPTELRAWIEGKTRLDRESRVRGWEERAGRLKVRSAHHEEQLQGAYAELRELGDLAVQEADAPLVQRLQWRIQDGDHALNQAEVAPALTEHRLDNLREGTGQTVPVRRSHLSISYFDWPSVLKTDFHNER
ncbi:hypothetical protein [Streptomyces sp. NRRL S-237]|uniref:hypothetical protein n=1 Tax=Streptomyces sp. NRRL S-237 TaxID=1463895 RepID=UPI0004C56483|nr:hypothetical protein [Streptomyces sp. NRRL S-237]